MDIAWVAIKNIANIRSWYMDHGRQLDQLVRPFPTFHLVQSVFWAMRHKTPLGSVSVKSRIRQGC